MRRLIRSAIPSMFHRRLVLQLAVFGVAIGALVGRLGILTLAEGGERLEQAESRLVRTTWTPTVRGRILDRTGRILAMDRPSYTAAVRFDVLSGAWAERGAASAARRVFGERLRDIPLVTVTPQIGTLAAGAGAIGVCVGAKCLQQQKLPARLHAGTPVDGLDAGVAEARDADLQYLLVCTGAIGGQNAAIVLKRSAG